MTPLCIALGITLLIALSRWAVNAQKVRILGLLAQRGEVPGGQLALAVGVLTYNALSELRDEGLVLCREDGIAHPERGGRQRFYYRLACKAEE